jgi:hypothetical protein
MIAAVAIAATVIMLPSDPLKGFAIGAGGVAYLANGGVVTKYQVQADKLTKIGELPDRFGSDLGLFARKNGLTIIDYGKKTAYLYGPDGKRVWQTAVRTPNRVKVDENGDLLVSYETASVGTKTAISSSVEPLIDSLGDEVFLPGLYDLAPGPKNGFYALMLDGRLFRITVSTAEKIATLKNALAIIHSKLGGVLVLTESSGRNEVLHVSDEGKTTSLWKAEDGAMRAIDFDHTGDGDIVLLGKTANGGVAYRIDPESTK